jgi:hypothetical protein
VEFRDLHFGKAAAEVEAAQEPELLLDGYFDPHDVPTRLRARSIFLVVGLKGSGKSASTEYLRLLSQDQSQLFVSRVVLNDFPFQDFANIKIGGSADQARHPGAWSWLLLLTLFASLSRDEGARSNSDPAYRETIRVLEQQGFLSVDRLRETVIRSSRSTITLKLPVGLEAKVEEARARSGLHLYSAVESLRSVAMSFTSESEHLIIIDGLDEILMDEQVQWKALAALVLEVNRLNSSLVEHGVPAMFVLLCRTDVYGRLPLPDANKIRQDSGVGLRWYPDSEQSLDSPLFQLANMKASVHHPDVADIIDRFLPSTMTLRSGQTIPIREYLLRKTRHTPRDYLRLLTYIQSAAPPTGRLPSHAIEAGVRKYCIDYFVPEVRNHLVGMIPDNDAFSIIGILSAMTQHGFNLSGLERMVLSDPRHKKLDVHGAIDQLIACGAVGTMPRGERPLFTYQNPEVELDARQTLVLHDALITGLDISRRL